MREKKNKQRAGRRIWVTRQRQAQADYQTRMVEYDRQRLTREAKEDQRREDKRHRCELHEHEERVAGSSHNLESEVMMVRGHKVYNTLYTNVYTLDKEYEGIQNPTPEQERLQAILQSTALQLQGRNPSVSHHPSQAGSQGHSQRVSIHDRIGPNPMQDRNNQDNRGN
jgi:hypothetical protein